jgi:hypothetical protein
LQYLPSCRFGPWVCPLTIPKPWPSQFFLQSSPG